MAEGGARVAAIILAAGTASRFRAGGGGEASKLVALLEGKALVRHVAEAALASDARPVIVVTGHARVEVEATLAGLTLTRVYNTAYAEGLAGSLKAGIAAVPSDAAGAVILLGDMPGVSAAIIDALIAALQTDKSALAVAPTQDGKRGNPVLLTRAVFPAVSGLSGDQGARKLIIAAGMAVIEAPVSSEAIFQDVDTREDLRALKSKK